MIGKVLNTRASAALLAIGAMFGPAGCRGKGADAATPIDSGVSIGAENIGTGQWWPALFPGIVLAITIFAFSMVGDVLNKRLGRTAI